MGSPPNFRLGLSKEGRGESIQKCEQIKDLAITVNSVFTPSANFRIAANKARGILYFKRKIIFMSDEGGFRASIQLVGVTTLRICHPCSKVREGS